MTVVLKIYKIIITPFLRTFLGDGCRYSPTCSEYSIEAYEKHGFMRGSYLTFRRLSKCHPFRKENMFVDPVPGK